MAKGHRRWVVKLGSSLITDDGRGLAHAAMRRWAAEIAALVNAGHEVVVVSSGSVAAGMSRFGHTKRPTSVPELQALAAVGQTGLVQAWDNAFAESGLAAAQVLLTHEDMSDRQRYLNARSTLQTLLKLNVVPVVNENDTVTTDEIRFGDNDTLGALVANLIEADVLLILTDQNGLYSADPRKDSAAKLISIGKAGDESLATMAGEGGLLGRGGMITKLTAAERAARSGAATLIAGGRNDGIITAIANGDDVGTLLVPAHAPMAARKQWIASQLQVRGVLHLDAGAVDMLADAGKSLLPVGVRRVEGDFRRGEVVDIVGPDHLPGLPPLARGLVSYSADAAALIAGQPSEKIEALLGFTQGKELVHRDNMVVL